jgi:hypothetical protein
LPAPPPQLALPAPEAPPMPRIAAPPEVPQISGPRPQLALPAPNPANRPMLPAPGPQVQGFPIEQTPLSRGVGNVARGAATGAARGGPRGAIVGGGSALMQEVLPYIMKNLNLR